jgi:tetratricopeptide (TPR) repeat protein
MTPCSRSTCRHLLLGALLQLGAAQLWAAEPVAAVAIPPAGSVQAIRQEYQAQYERLDWTAAATTAQRLVDAARAKKTDPLALADALVLLGNAEIGGKNMTGAETHFAEALQLVEERVGATNSRLIEPLRGLGFALAAQGKHDVAVPLMERALVIWRRNYGLFDPKQQGLLRNLAESEAANRHITEGERHILYLQSIGERRFGREDPRLVPVLCIVGEWYVQANLLTLAREKFRAALDIVDEKVGKNSLIAVEPLRGLANSYVSELRLANFGPRSDDRDRTNAIGVSNDTRATNPRYLNPDGERVLARALKILDSNPERPPALLVETLIQQGDLLQLRNNFEQALPYYRRAAVTMSADPSARPGTINPLEFPTQVYFPVPLLAIRNLNRPPEEVVERFVEAEFTVTAQGAVKDIKVAEQDATPRQIAETVEAVRVARYRPKFVNGDPVDTTAVVYRQVFKQRKDAE